jgi:hypothetical protein
MENPETQTRKNKDKQNKNTIQKTKTMCNKYPTKIKRKNDVQQVPHKNKKRKNDVQ